MMRLDWLKLEINVYKTELWTWTRKLKRTY